MKSFHSILLFLFLVASQPGQAQFLGEYCHGFGFGTECIEFLPNNEFRYSHAHCTGHDQGVGKYQLKGRQLVLNFRTDTLTLQNKNLAEIKSFGTTIDSILIEVEVIDKDIWEPLPFVNVLIRNRAGKMVYACVADIEGKAKISLFKSEEVLTLEIASVGYQIFSLELVPKLNYQVKLKMVMDGCFGKQFKLGETMRYRIKNLRPNSIDLKPSYYKEARFNRYAKQ